MAQGAAGEVISEEIKWYYKKEASLPTMPANLAAAAALVVADNLFTETTGDPVIPGVHGAGETPGNITARVHGASAVKYKRDITPAPDAGENTFDVPWLADLQNDLHQELVEATAGTYGLVVVDIRTKAGNGTIGIASGDAEGSLLVLVVQHDDATTTLPSGASFMQCTTTFTVVKDSADAVGRKFFHYGEP